MKLEAEEKGLGWRVKASLLGVVVGTAGIAVWSEGSLGFFF